MLSSVVAKKKPRRPGGTAIPALIPALKPALKPIIEPVVERLDRHETLLAEVKKTLDVQFRRIAAIQAQMDRLLAALRTHS